MAGGVCRGGLPTLAIALFAAGCADTGSRRADVTDPPREPPAGEAAAADVPAREDSAGASGEEVAPTVAISPCDLPADGDDPMFERATQGLADILCDSARWLDGLFGGPGHVPAGHTTHGRVELSAFYSEFYGTDLRIRLNARVRLPALESRLSAFVGRENDEDYVRDRSEGFGLRSLFSALNEPVDWFAGLGYDFSLLDNVHSDFRIGVRSVAHPQLFVQNRFLADLFSDPINLIQLRLTPFWNTRDGFGVTGSFDASRVIAPTLLLRWGTAATFTEESPGVGWRSALILYQDLGNKRGLAWELFVRGQSELPESLAEYGGLVVYRHPIARELLTVLFQAGYSWPRSDPLLPREGAYGVGLGLEIPLGR